MAAEGQGLRRSLVNGHRNGGIIIGSRHVRYGMDSVRSVDHHGGGTMAEYSHGGGTMAEYSHGEVRLSSDNTLPTLLVAQSLNYSEYRLRRS